MNDAQMSDLIDRLGKIAAALQARNDALGQSCSFGDCLVAASNLMLLRAQTAERAPRGALPPVWWS